MLVVLAQAIESLLQFTHVLGVDLALKASWLLHMYILIKFTM